MTVIEKPGQFYLGRMHDLTTGETSPRELHYDAGDLTTHAVCVGMTGSGKTAMPQEPFEPSMSTNSRALFRRLEFEKRKHEVNR